MHGAILFVVPSALWYNQPRFVLATFTAPQVNFKPIQNWPLVHYTNVQQTVFALDLTCCRGEPR